MQLLKTVALCVLLSLCYARTSAQTHPFATHAALKKPELFNDLPQRLAWNTPSFSQLLQKEIGAPVRLPITHGFIFSGVVVSKSDAAETRSKTVVIKSTERSGAALTITGIRQENGTYRYSGRLLSLKHSDAFELVEEGGVFALEKRRLDELVSE